MNRISIIHFLLFICYFPLFGQENSNLDSKQILIDVKDSVNVLKICKREKSYIPIFKPFHDKLTKLKITYSVYSNTNVRLAKATTITITRSLDSTTVLRKVNIINLDANNGFTIYRLQKFKRQSLKWIYDNYGKIIDKTTISHDEVVNLLNNLNKNDDK